MPYASGLLATPTQMVAANLEEVFPVSSGLNHHSNEEKDLGVETSSLDITTAETKVPTI